jgi:hypothetical protein
MSSINLTTYAEAAVQFMGVLDSGEGLSAQQLSDALAVANTLLESWYTASVLLINIEIASFTLAAGSFTPATMPQFADTTTALTLPAGWDRIMKLGLCVELAPQYDMQPPASVEQALAQALQAVLKVPATLPKAG